MKTTIDIPEDELKDAIRYAKAKTKRDAVLTAMLDYNRRQRMAELVKYSGSSDFMMSNAAIEALDEKDHKSWKSKPRRRGRK
jgi:Arc/MetJ family transcription regulator